MGSLASQYDATNAKDGAGAGDDDGFYQQLADDAPAAGADGTADGELMPARAPTGEQKNGAIGAADDQQEHNAGKKERQGGAGILLENPDDRLQREMHVAGTRPIRCFVSSNTMGSSTELAAARVSVGPELDHQYVGTVAPEGRLTTGVRLAGR